MIAYETEGIIQFLTSLDEILEEDEEQDLEIEIKPKEEVKKVKTNPFNDLNNFLY